LYKNVTGMSFFLSTSFGNVHGVYELSFYKLWSDINYIHMGYMYLYKYVKRIITLYKDTCTSSLT